VADSTERMHNLTNVGCAWWDGSSGLQWSRSGELVAMESENILFPRNTACPCPSVAKPIDWSDNSHPGVR